VSSILAGFDLFRDVLRQALLVVALVAAVLALADWLTRTRRIGPFTPFARFVRRWVSPIFAPMERVVVRAGGRPSTAPWWMVVAIAVAGLLLLALVDLGRGIVLEALIGIDRPSRIPVILIDWTFDVLELALLVRVLSSWFSGLRYSRWVRWTFPLTEWLLAPLRRVIPSIGMIDVTPIAAYFILVLLQTLVVRAFAG
jgi:YggT family protein